MGPSAGIGTRPAVARASAQFNYGAPRAVQTQSERLGQAQFSEDYEMRIMRWTPVTPSREVFNLQDEVSRLFGDVATRFPASRRRCPSVCASGGYP